MTYVQFFLINLGAVITAAGGVFLKRLSSALGGGDGYSLWKIVLNANLWMGGMCYVLPVVFWAYLLKTMELTKLQPLLSVVYIYSVGFAYLFLGEAPSAFRLLGIAVIIVGVVIVGGS